MIQTLHNRRGAADPRDVANYSVAEASRWLGVIPATLRTWVAGTTYQTRRGTAHGAAVIKPAASSPLALSFWNLVEASVIAAIRRTHGVSFQKVRRALRYVEQELGDKRPLIQAQFETDGIDLFVERYGHLIAANQAGQVVIRELIAASLTRIDRDATGLAARLYPWTHSPREPRSVAIDPAVAFGRPTLVDTNLAIDVIMERFRAGDRLGDLADDYRIDVAKIEDVVRWTAGGAAAA